jgi:hypothetical protein
VRRHRWVWLLIAVEWYGWLQRLGRTYGSTEAERKAPLPGDELCRHPHYVTDHGITIDAPPAAVWPWLVQMGWGRGQWYTARWVDRLLFPHNGPSADTIHPEWQGLAVGDRVLDGPPESECAFVVALLAPERHLVLHSREHLPPQWRQRFGAWIDFTWAFVLRDLGDGRTRFSFRCRARLGPLWVRAFYWLALIPADFVMARQMMRGVKQRAELLRLTDGSVRADLRSRAGDATGPDARASSDRRDEPSGVRVSHSG